MYESEKKRQFMYINFAFLNQSCNIPKYLAQHIPPGVNQSNHVPGTLSGK